MHRHVLRLSAVAKEMLQYVMPSVSIPGDEEMENGKEHQALRRLVEKAMSLGKVTGCRREK